MNAFIVATARTPIGRAVKGSLVDCRPDDLSASILQALLAKVPTLDPNEIEDVIWGCAYPQGEQGDNVARIAAVLAGLDVPGTTVNRFCSSSLQTIRMAAHAIAAGEGDVFVAGGVECVSRFSPVLAEIDFHNPRFDAARARTAGRGEAPWAPGTGLPDIYLAMGDTAENVAEFKHISREEQDEYACLSQNRAVKAQESGFFELELTPITTPDGTVISKDDGPRPDTTIETLAQLRPIFRPGGSVTAGNACPLNDGAAAVVVMSEEGAARHGARPLARIVSSGVSALNPEIMGLGPVEASRQALARAALTIDDIDLVEMNEAFAAQVIPSARELGIPWDKLNVHGGGIALGHPFGMTGARIMTTLIHGLEETGGRYGLETMCVGGGQGMAMVVERL